MILHSPFSIGSRLLPCLTIDGATLALQREGTGAYGKPQWRWFIDLPDGSEFSQADLCGWEGTQGMFESLLSFLTACGEGLRYQQSTGRDSESADLFPPPVAAWAASHSDELSMLECALQEATEKGESLIEE